MIAYKPLLDRALELAEHRPRHVRRAAAAQARGGHDRGPRPRLGRAGGRRRAGRPACPWPRPTRSTSSTRRARPAARRASSATTAATPSRCSGRMAQRLRRRRPATSSGPPRTSAGSSATPTSSTRRCSPGARPSCTRASRSARPTPGPSGASIADHGVRTLFTAPTAIRAITQGGSGGRARRPPRPRRGSSALPRRRAARPRHLPVGGAHARRRPVIDHWWQTETGWPIAANCLRDRAAARQARLADAARARLRRAHPARRRLGRRPGRGGRDRDPAAAAAGDAADALERRRPVPGRATCPPSPATTRPATAA